MTAPDQKPKVVVMAAPYEALRQRLFREFPCDLQLHAMLTETRSPEAVVETLVRRWLTARDLGRSLPDHDSALTATIARWDRVVADIVRYFNKAATERTIRRFAASRKEAEALIAWVRDIDRRNRVACATSPPLARSRLCQ